MAGWPQLRLAYYALILGLSSGTFPLPVSSAASNLFPYDGHKEYLVQSETKVPVPLAEGVAIPFHGMKYSKAWISLNGAITFGKPPVGSSVRRTTLPLETDEDLPMAAVYYTNTESVKRDADSPELQSKVFLHVYNWATDGDSAVLATLGREVRLNAVGDWARFQPKHAIMATWVNLRNQGCYDDNVDCPRNTYQAVVMTDDVWTFAIYNYHNLTWYGGSNDGCDRNTGMGPDCFAAQVGFNAGGSRDFTPLPFSNQAEVASLDSHAGSRVVGRHIWRVSHNVIVREGCSTADRTLTIYPQSGGMLGGEEVVVAGPCLPPVPPTVTCKVSDVEFAGRVIDDGRIACVLPPLAETGDNVDIMVKVSNGEYYRSVIQITHPQRRRFDIKLHNFHSKWIQRKPAELTLSWDPKALNTIWFDDGNMTTEPPERTVDKVDIILFGYREIKKDASQVTEWKMLHILSTGNANTGEFSFMPKDHRCVLSDCDWHLGVIKIVPNDERIEPYLARGLFSKITPVGWYIDQAMEGQHGQNWPDVLCREWKDSGEEWRKDLMTCPCSMGQAYTDRGRYIVGADCDDEEPEAPCPFRPNAQICFVSRLPSPNNAQTECCYEKMGNLIYSGDSVNGSFSGRVHEDGIRPYKRAGDIPSLSHWLVDKVPHMWCCVWSTTNDLCGNHYQPRRPTPDCRQHAPPKTAVAFGDPHFRTFDGTEYTFNGRAEYWLLHVTTLPADDNFQLQARMENDLGQIENLTATVITAVAMQEGLQKSEEVPNIMAILRPPLALDRLAIYVNDKYQSFYDRQQRSFFSKDMKRETIIRRNSDGISMSNFTISFQSGVSVTVAESHGLIHVFTTVPPLYFRKTTGLFGSWDDNPVNDLKTRDGNHIVLPDNSKEVHETFGRSWVVNWDESIFTYFGAKTWGSFQHLDFIPSYEAKFPDNEHSVTEEDVQRTCAGISICIFDYKATLNEKVATSSVKAEIWAREMSNMSAPVVACPYIDVPRSYRKTTGSLAGTGTVSITGCHSGYSPVGELNYECVDTGGIGNWSPTPNAACKDDDQIAADQSRMAAAIAVPITLVVLITLVAIAAFMIFRRRKAESKPPSGPTKFGDLPPQLTPVNPEPNPVSFSQYPGTGLSTSRTSIGSKASRASDNSIVLTQEIHAARPARPVSKVTQDHPPQPSFPAPPPVEEYQPGYQPGGGQVKGLVNAGMTTDVPPAERTPTPPGDESRGAYVNRASDADYERILTEPSPRSSPGARAQRTSQEHLPPGDNYTFDRTGETPGSATVV